MDGSLEQAIGAASLVARMEEEGKGGQLHRQWMCKPLCNANEKALVEGRAIGLIFMVTQRPQYKHGLSVLA